MQKVYLEKVLENALLLDGEWDYVIVHDPQPAALLHLHRVLERQPARDELDLALPHRPDRREREASGSSSARTSSGTTRRCGRWTSSSPRRSTMDNIVTAPPCIDPLSVKNLELPDPFVHEICKQYGIDTERPIVCQVSRYDPWKDPVGVIEAFRIGAGRRARRAARARRLDGDRRPRGLPGVGAGRDGPRPATATSTCSRTSSRSATCRSTRSSAPPTSSSRSRCARASGSPSPRASGRAGRSIGGPRRRHRAADPGRSGRLPRRLDRRVRAAHASSCSPIPSGADAMGARGQEHVRRNFLSTRELEDWLRLFGTLERTSRVIVVSNRGPFRSSSDPDGTFAAQRGRRRRGQRADAAAREARRRDTWVAAAISDDDRAAIRAGAPTPTGWRPSCSTLDRAQARAALRRRLERRRCGSCTTACSTWPAGPGSTGASARPGRVTSR